jgi:putative ABC transport system substrate-binding protein
MSALWIVAVIGVMLALVTAPMGAGAQPAAGTPRVVIFGVTPVNEALAQSFKQGLDDRGYAEGRNVAVEARDAGGKPGRLAEVATKIVRLNADLVLARGAGAVSASKQATDRIPIVAVDLESDPVASGFVQTFARPGGNITGIFLDLPELPSKQMQLLKELLPRVARVAIIGDPLLNGPQFPATQTAAQALAIRPLLLEVRASADLAGAMEAATRGRTNAVLLLSSPLVFFHRAEIAEFAMKRRLPAASMFVEFAEAGGFMSYGPDLREAFRRAGVYAGRILQGVRPQDLPVERPAKFEWVVNLKTAKALGLAVPAGVPARADRIIE